MKILAIGDFHGKCPVDLKQVCKDNKIDIIISPGDFCSFHLRAWYFKNKFRKNNAKTSKNLEEKNRKLDVQDGIKMLEELRKLNLPTFITTGNLDNTGLAEYGKIRDKQKGEDYFTPEIKKQSFTLLDLAKANYDDFTLIGFPRSSFLGRKMKRSKYSKINISTEIYDAEKKKLTKLFKEATNPIIYVPHNPPYGMKKMDILGQNAHKLVRGKHYGNKLSRELIDTYQPLICICGHIHETQGMEKLGNTTVVNCGHGEKGQYAIIDVSKDKVKRVDLINQSTEITNK